MIRRLIRKLLEAPEPAEPRPLYCDASINDCRAVYDLPRGAYVASCPVFSVASFSSHQGDADDGLLRTVAKTAGSSICGRLGE